MVNIHNEENFKRACELLELSEIIAEDCLQTEIPVSVKERLFRKYDYLEIDDLKKEMKSKNPYVKSVIFLLVYQNSHIFNKERIRIETLRKKEEEEDLPWWRVKKER